MGGRGQNKRKSIWKLCLHLNTKHYRDYISNLKGGFYSIIGNLALPIPKLPFYSRFLGKNGEIGGVGPLTFQSPILDHSKAGKIFSKIRWLIWDFGQKGPPKLPLVGPKARQLALTTPRFPRIGLKN